MVTKMLKTVILRFSWDRILDLFLVNLGAVFYDSLPNANPSYGEVKIYEKGLTMNQTPHQPMEGI